MTGVHGVGDSCLHVQSYLQSQIGPVPPPDSHGCCTAVGLTDATLCVVSPATSGVPSPYINNHIPVWVPIFGERPAAVGPTTPTTSLASGRSSSRRRPSRMAATSTRSGSRSSDRYACGENNPVVPGQLYCCAPGDPFVIGETGAVQLVR